ncbi:MAG: anaerobic ribonucleoside-triphosphate reductase activating protein [Christensenellaceae bacterium]|nr:anaerobic ribonucleoside-triphosphate reductase activating protein [Christensenellaceae bacterium]
MDIRIYGLVEDSIVDGPGYRLAVFTQGCPHGCPGCHNPESHDFSGGRLMDTAEIISRYGGNPLMDGITLSGGDPLCQPEACLELARAAHEQGLSVWCYTGYVWEVLQKEADPARMALLREVDVLVDGPFLLSERSLALQFCGSRNQRLIDVPKTLAAGEIALWSPPDWDVR